MGMLLHVTGVQYLGDYRLEVAFSDGSIREVDLADELYGPVFEELRDRAAFARVYVDDETRTVAWPNGADLAPEFLHSAGRVISPA